MKKFYKKKIFLLGVAISCFCFMCPALDEVNEGEKGIVVDTKEPRRTRTQRLFGFFRNLLASPRDKLQSLPVRLGTNGHDNAAATLPSDENQVVAPVSLDENQGLTKAEMKALKQGSVTSFLNRLGLFKPKISKEQKEFNVFKEKTLKKLSPTERDIFEKVFDNKSTSSDQMQKLLQIENEIMQECGTFYLYYSREREFEDPYFEGLKEKFAQNTEALKILDLLIKDKNLRERAIVEGASKVLDSFAKAKLSDPQRSLVRRVLQLCEIDTITDLRKNGGPGIIALVGGLDSFKVLMLDVVRVVQESAPLYEQFKDKANPTEEELKTLADSFKEKYVLEDTNKVKDLTFAEKLSENRFLEIGEQIIIYFKSMSKEEKALWGK